MSLRHVKRSVKCHQMPVLQKQLYLTFTSNNQFKISQSPYSYQWLLPSTGYIFYLSPWKLFAMIKTKGVFRTKSTTLTTYLRYPVNFFLRKTSSQMFEWVLNTPLKTFLLLQFSHKYFIKIAFRKKDTVTGINIQICIKICATIFLKAYVLFSSCCKLILTLFKSLLFSSKFEINSLKIA